MNLLFNLLCSLVLAMIFSFLTPLAIAGMLFLILGAGSYLPGIEGLMWTLEINIVRFLTIFGDGDALMGILIIGASCAIVGGLFDLFNFYRYQNLGGH